NGPLGTPRSLGTPLATPRSLRGASSVGSHLGGSSRFGAGEAMSRCSSSPSCKPRHGPTEEAAEGASLFGVDLSRGVNFGSTPRCIEKFTPTVGPGPAAYNIATYTTELNPTK
ncbi:unnamed protein product, partial [Polarella glacialis]